MSKKSYKGTGVQAEMDIDKLLNDDGCPMPFSPYDFFNEIFDHPESLYDMIQKLLITKALNQRIPITTQDFDYNAHLLRIAEKFKNTQDFDVGNKFPDIYIFSLFSGNDSELLDVHKWTFLILWQRDMPDMLCMSPQEILESGGMLCNFQTLKSSIDYMICQKQKR